MPGQTPLQDEQSSVCLQVETDQAAFSQNVAAGRRSRFLWTGFGFAVLLLTGVSAFPLASHAPAKPAHLAQEIAFNHHLLPGGLLPAKLAGSGSAHPIFFSPHALPKWQQRHQISSPHMSATAVSGEALNDDSEDDDFKAALSRLAPLVELPTLTRKVRALDSMIVDAMNEKNYEQADRLRKKANDLRSQDPVALFDSLRRSMWAAAQAGRLGEANQIEAPLRIVKKRLPAYQLGGRWMGSVPPGNSGASKHEWGHSDVQIEYDGDTVIASKMDGEVIFKVDIAEPIWPRTPKEWASQRHDEGGVINGLNFMQYFEGEGMVDEGGGLIPGVYIPGRVPGKMYLMDDGDIGFLWSSEGGDERAEEPAGGVPELVVSAGVKRWIKQRMDQQASGDGSRDGVKHLLIEAWIKEMASRDGVRSARAGDDQAGTGNSGSDSRRDGGGGQDGGGLFVLFKRVEKYDVTARRQESA